MTTGTGNLNVTLLNIVTVPPTVIPATSPSGGSTPTPGPAPGPTPSTFNFTQQYYAAFITASDAPYTQSGLLAYSWGSRTGVYDGYFYGTTEGSRTMATGVTASSASTGTSIATAAGTVSGILGQTLTGSMTVNGTDSLGNAVARTGTVTILPTGELTYNWTDTVSRDSVIKATGTGTTSRPPGPISLRPPPARIPPAPTWRVTRPPPPIMAI